MKKNLLVCLLLVLSLNSVNAAVEVSTVAAAPGDEVRITSDDGRFAGYNNVGVFQMFNAGNSMWWTSVGEWVWSEDGRQISFTVPSNVLPGTYGLSVFNYRRSVNEKFGTFTITGGLSQGAVIESVTPDPAYRGSRVTLKGSGFSKVRNDIALKQSPYDGQGFYSVVAASFDGESLVFFVPDKIPFGNYTISLFNGVADGNIATISVQSVQAARLDRLEPMAPRAGEEVVLHGEYFWLSENAVYIRYLEGGVNGGLFKFIPVGSEDGTTLRFKIPSDVPSGRYRLLVNNGRAWPSNELFFDVAPTPSLTVLSPKGGESWVIGRINTVSNDAKDLGIVLPGVGYILVKGGIPVGSLVPVINSPSVSFQWQTGQYKNENGEILTASPGSDYSIRMYVSKPLIFITESGFFNLVTSQPSGGGGGGTAITTPPEPRPPVMLPGIEITGNVASIEYHWGSLLDESHMGWWCFVRLTKPLPENVAVWWDSEWSGQYPVPMVAVNVDGTYIGFPLLFQISHLWSERLKEIAEVQFFELPSP